MAELGWVQLVGVALGSGVTVKLLDIIYQEFRRKHDHTKSAERFVDEHLDPLLKSVDELVGKLRSAAEADFKSLHGVDTATERLVNNDFASLLYLFGRFWARVEIIRLKGLSVAITQDERGKRLQNFFDCLESRRVRLVDRTSQRAIGELLLTSAGPSFDTVTFIEFVKRFEADGEVRRWIAPLSLALGRMHHTIYRQRLLQYAAVLHALIDTLDPSHVVTRQRPAIPNKLTKRSRRDLKYRVFGVYLSFVARHTKYLGTPKKRSKN